MKECKHNWCMEEGGQFAKSDNFEFKIFICSECGYRKRKKVWMGFIEDDYPKERSK